MPELPPPHVPDADLSKFRYWKPEAQQRALDLLRQAEMDTWRPFYCPNPACDGNPHDDWDFPHARADQRPPRWAGDWLTLLLRGGRGSGKTRTGSEITHRVSKRVRRMALIAPTGPDLRETMVEGVSGIMATAPPGQLPLWEPSKKKITFPNGCVAQGFSAEEPDRLRGPQHGFAWCDEPAHYPAVEEVWDNLLFGLRLGSSPKIVATTTPLPSKWVKKLIQDPLTIDRVVSTYANLHNLAPTFRRTILDRYEGTRQGRQELHGEVLEDVEGARWSWEMFQWVAEAPDLVRIVVAVDPAGTANKRSDETGIVVLGISAEGVIYVLADYTGRYSPGGWGEKTLDAADEFLADAIIYEKNYGGEMVRHVLETAAEQRRRVIPAMRGVTSRRGKEVRAEPIVALYEKGRVIHVGERGDLGPLEEEQTSWVPGQGPSPNRVDALVHGATDLAAGAMPSAIANPNTLLRRGPEWPGGGRGRIA